MSPHGYRYQKQWRFDKAVGRPSRRVASGPVRDHVLTLNGYGFCLDSIASAAGVSASIIERIALGEHETALRRTAALVMAVTPHLIFERATHAQNVPAYAARRRIAALHRIGWRTADIDEAIGRRVLQGNITRGKWVYARTHRAIAEVYARLSLTPGPSELTRKRATTAGNIPPLAWDDIDDPLAVPNTGDEPLTGDNVTPEAEAGICSAPEYLDEIAIELALAGKHPTLTLAERHAAIILGTAREMGAEILADLLDTTDRTITRHRRLHAAECTIVTPERNAA